MTALIVGLCGFGFIGAVAYREGDKFTLTMCAICFGASAVALYLGFVLGVPL